MLSGRRQIAGADLDACIIASLAPSAIDGPLKMFSVGVQASGDLAEARRVADPIGFDEDRRPADLKSPEFAVHGEPT